jgi:hypothetical protein
MRRRLAPFAMPTLVQLCRQSADIPQMSSPHERHIRKQRQKIKKEHDTRFLEVEEHPLMEGEVYED